MITYVLIRRATALTAGALGVFTSADAAMVYAIEREMGLINWWFFDPTSAENSMWITGSINGKQIYRIDRMEVQER